MWKRLVRLLVQIQNSERGEAYVEYVCLAALAVLIILVAVQYFFGGVADVFNRLGDTLRSLG
jgi:Flp pilus assembly pilin Flp